MQCCYPIRLSERLSVCVRVCTCFGKKQKKRRAELMLIYIQENLLCWSAAVFFWKQIAQIKIKTVPDAQSTWKIFRIRPLPFSGRSLNSFPSRFSVCLPFSSVLESVSRVSFGCLPLAWLYSGTTSGISNDIYIRNYYIYIFFSFVPYIFGQIVYAFVYLMFSHWALFWNI